MKVSIIVPVYNIETYIGRCIESIIHQTYKNLEIILVDDGSTDKSGKICDMYATKDSRIHCIHKSNGGLVSARKAGACHVTGEYVINIDGDDWVEKEYVEKFVARITDKQEDIICAIDFYKDYNDNSIVYCADRYAEVDITADCIQKEMLDNIKGRMGFSYDIEYALWLECIESRLYTEIQSTIDDKISYNEDAACVVRCLGRTDKVGFIHNCGYHYCQRNDSITGKRSRDNIESIELAYKSTIDFLVDSKDKDSLKEILDGVYIRAMMINDFVGLQEGKNYLVPFESVTYGSKIIVYGMGVMGQQIVSYLVDNDHYDLVAWTDSNVKNKSEMKEKANMIEPEEICKCDYDYILIASTKNVFVQQIEEKLYRLGVTDNKIVHL